MKHIAYLLIAVALLTGCKEHQPKEEPHKFLYEIDCTDYKIVTDTVRKGETASVILTRFGMSMGMIDRIDRACRPMFDLRKMRVGNAYTAFLSGDSIKNTLEYFVYEKNVMDYLVIAVCGDSVSVREGQKPVTTTRVKRKAVIASSLWNSMDDAGMPQSLAADLENMYGWSVDFFGLQDGDSFTVIYDELAIDSVKIGVGQVWGAVFTNKDKNLFAIPFRQNGKVSYWDEHGNSMRKMFLKAPLKYSRVSSRFTAARLHPIYKIYRPHFGVDYAAPSGTPVHAIAEGTIIFKGWSRGEGNTIKIKHGQGYSSGYMHLRGYAKGIARGRHVSQGQLIGYVGSTGASTGPHLDFRIWKGTKPINPLKVPGTTMGPIAASNRAHFNFIRDKIMAELGDSLKGAPLMQLDSIEHEHKADTVKTTANVKTR